MFFGNKPTQKEIPTGFESSNTFPRSEVVYLSLGALIFNTTHCNKDNIKPFYQDSYLGRSKKAFNFSHCLYFVNINFIIFKQFFKTIPIILTYNF